MLSDTEAHLLARRCAEQLRALRCDLLEAEQRHSALLIDRAPGRAPSVRNFLHYLALRGQDVRPLQEDLARLGLSSLGRAESHTLYAVDVVLHALGALTGSLAPWPASKEAPGFDGGAALLARNTSALLGPVPLGRRVRIMVTLPGEAARDLPLVRSLIERGMNVARINCAHDDADVWHGLVATVRDAAEAVGQPCLVQMDLGGPKLRTGPCAGEITVRPGDLLLVTRAGEPGAPSVAGADGGPVLAHVACSLPQVLDQIEPGDRLFIDDGKIGGRIESVDHLAARVRITQAKPGGSAVRADRGINLPDSHLDLPALTHKDRTDLQSVARLADIVALSFAERPGDVAELGADRLGLVLKIETRRGFSGLPRLLLQGMETRPFGVLIARGDMAVECGYERLAEVQEEILWLCEAAHVPVIWATQVLDRLARKGLPTRAEVTDAAMAERAECVMLNKGPHILDAIALLDGILRRMASHQNKKTATLRPLSVTAGL